MRPLGAPHLKIKVNCSPKVGPGRSTPSQAVHLRKVPRDKAHQGCSRHRMDQQKQQSSLLSSVVSCGILPAAVRQIFRNQKYCPSL
jgi:hypothetical protein